MTPEQLIQVCVKYETELQKLVSEARRTSPDISGPDDRTACQHALWMCEQTRGFATQDMEKACRWLGYIQGVLWMAGLRTINEMRDENR